MILIEAGRRDEVLLKFVRECACNNLCPRDSVLILICMIHKYGG